MQVPRPLPLWYQLLLQRVFLEVFLVTRPLFPDRMAMISHRPPFSAAIFLTSGEMKALPLAGGGGGSKLIVGAGAAGAGGGAAGAGSGCGSGSAAGAASAAGAGLLLSGAASPSAPTKPSVVPTLTVSPSGTSILKSTPSEGAGISASTLSVEMTRRSSSFLTSSPGFLSHFTTMPSAMDSPSRA